MRHPFWIINSSLLLLLLLSTGFIALSRPTLPKPRKTKRTSQGKTTKGGQAVALEKIYNNDLFDTYHQQEEPPQQPDYAKPIPKPPSPGTVHVPAEPKQPFLPPLDVTLKGVMLINDDSMNIAVIADNKTKKDENYKVGDAIEDAQVVRILGNRVVLIRSNGQQETLYLTEKDVLADPMLMENNDDWAHVVKKVSDNHLLLDPETFIQSIPDLAHFIDTFDLTTVYKEGKSAGCRVGKITHNSLGDAMGIESYDIITKVANIPAETTDQRLDIYNKLVALDAGSSFDVQLLRDDEPVTLNIKLYDLQDPFKKLSDTKDANKEEKTGILIGPSDQELERERIALLKEKYDFAPTTQELMIQQKKKMLSEGKQGRLKDFSLTRES